MTQEDLLKAIEVNVEGQFNQLDIAGVMPAILKALVAQASPIEVEDITALTDDQLNALECGSKVVKVTGKQKHAYWVSYKGEGVGQGLCLTYADAAGTETVSYDFTDDGWVYNSTDKGSFA